MATTKRTFEEWKKLVDAHVSALLGLGIDDLPDLVDAQREYSEGTTPSQFAVKAIRACKGGAW